jgi:hypothetical protein
MSGPITVALLEAIMERCADATLTGLLDPTVSGDQKVWHALAPPTVNPPLLIWSFFNNSSTAGTTGPSRGNGARIILEAQTWQAAILTDGTNLQTAKAIAARLDALLDAQTWDAGNGLHILDCVRVQQLPPQPETVGGLTIVHTPTLYQFRAY